MRTPRPPSQALLAAPTASALFAIALLVAGTALAGRMVTAMRVYEPRPGLVCPNDGMVDFAGLTPPGRWTPPHADDQALYARRLQILASQPMTAPAAIAVSRHGTFVPSDSSVTAVRSARGVWALTIDRQRWPSVRWTTHSGVTLTPSQGAALERMLVDPCLYAEPPLVGRVFPTVLGGGGSATCFDGADTEVNIRFAGHRRSAVQGCGLHGLTGALVRSLLTDLDGAPGQTSVVVPASAGR